jgi:trehalose/maltose hydrolase-like predicted phosphorylase
MLDGFLGFEPTAEGCRIGPRLPAEWPELTVTSIRLQDHLIDVTARRDGSITVCRRGAGSRPLAIEVAGKMASLAAGADAQVTLP